MEFGSPKVPTSDDQLPQSVLSYISGYAHNEPRTLPTKKQVCKIIYDHWHNNIYYFSGPFCNNHLFLYINEFFQ